MGIRPSTKDIWAFCKPKDILAVLLFYLYALTRNTPLTIILKSSSIRLIKTLIISEYFILGLSVKTEKTSKQSLP